MELWHGILAGLLGGAGSAAAIFKLWFIERRKLRIEELKDLHHWLRAEIDRLTVEVVANLGRIEKLDGKLQTALDENYRLKSELKLTREK